jgi:hypothetical protein
MVRKVSPERKRFTMAKNTGKNYRKGAVRKRDQVFNPHNERWVKQDEQGKFID